MKPTFQDIIPPEKRSIRNLTISPKKPKTKETLPEPEYKPEQNLREVQEEIPDDVREEKDDYEDILYEHNPPRIILWIIAATSIVGLVFALSLLFSGATVYVTVHSDVFNLDHQSFVATSTTIEADATSSAATPGITVPVFQTLTLEDTASVDVPATGETTVSTKATGNVVIFNNYSKSAQELVATTRLQTSDGRIYHLVKGVLVPGQSIVGGKLTPGSVNAAIIADAAGSSYNADPQDFTIVGFKGTPKYTGFFARSKGSITGGASGLVKKVADEDMAKATSSLEQDLRDSLTKKIISQTPDRFTLDPDSISIKYTLLPQATVTDQATSTGDNHPTNSTTISEKGVATAFIFDTTSLVQVIAATSTPVTSDDVNKLSFEISTSTSAGLAFTLTGTTTIKQTFSNELLKNDLKGLNRTQAQIVFQKYGFENAESVIKPFWKSTFPDSTDKIVIQRLN
ncbi:MAG: hypothetical protein PHF79_01295 [Candidatus Pacebacteria bacterium]|nr:hypothetical protein [Candidatus Paceibacterota bacterium]